jgi:hypothetical protein
VDGKVTADSTHADDLGTITVARQALNNNSSGNCYVKVNYEPQMTASGIYGSIGEHYVNCSSVFTLPYGSFIAENVNEENISVIAGDATVSISMTDEGELKIYVKGYDPYYFGEDVFYEYPMAKISANVTTFNVDLWVYIGKPYTYSLTSFSSAEEEI